MPLLSELAASALAPETFASPTLVSPVVALVIFIGVLVYAQARDHVSARRLDVHAGPDQKTIEVSAVARLTLGPLHRQLRLVQLVQVIVHGKVTVAAHAAHVFQPIVAAGVAGQVFFNCVLRRRRTVGVRCGTGHGRNGSLIHVFSHLFANDSSLVCFGSSGRPDTVLFGHVLAQQTLRLGTSHLIAMVPRV